MLLFFIRRFLLFDYVRQESVGINVYYCPVVIGSLDSIYWHSELSMVPSICHISTDVTDVANFVDL